jgi:hypothetical protein
MQPSEPAEGTGLPAPPLSPRARVFLSNRSAAPAAPPFKGAEQEPTPSDASARSSASALPPPLPPPGDGLEAERNHLRQLRTEYEQKLSELEQQIAVRVQQELARVRADGMLSA